MFLDSWRLRRMAQKAAKQYARGDEEGALAFLTAWRSKCGVDADVALADALADQGRSDVASRVLERALDVEPRHWNARVLLAELADASGHPDRALEFYRQLNAERPLVEPLARVLANIEIDHGDPARAIAVIERFGEDASFALRHALARALFAVGRSKDAFEIAKVLVEYLDAEARRVFSAGIEPQQYADVKELYRELVAETQGYEAVVVDAARRRQLDSRAALSFTLLAGELMNRSPRIAVHTELKTVDEYEALGKALLEKDPKSAAGMCQLGIAAFRNGDDNKAVELFEAARDADPTHFGALLGSGAARLADQRGLHLAARRLPAVTCWPGLLEVVPDWPALTEPERQVVCASVEPLKWLLPQLAAASARMHILPLDMRVVDLPPFAHFETVRASDDHRSYAALPGMAEDGNACARIESLLDVSSEGWMFAHEFAHLAHLLLDPDAQRTIEELFERASGEEYAFIQYQLRDPHEFFACAYVDYLLERHLPRREVTAELEGVALETRRFVAALAQRTRST